jgi:hypothetical protein
MLNFFAEKYISKLSNEKKYSYYLKELKTIK